MIHYSFFGYMIATAIIMIFCVMAYRLLLENKVRPSANRLILLSICAVSFIMPLLISLIPEPQEGMEIEIGNTEFSDFIGKIGETQKGTNWKLNGVLLWLTNFYFLGLFITLLYSLLTIGHLIFLMRKSRKMEMADTKVYVHNNKKLSSFSWCNKIFLYEKSLNSEFNDLQMLVAHEKAHVDKSHWIDLTLAQIVLIFQWFNPAAWFMRSELQRIHEYEADEAVLKSGIDERDYQMLLIQNISGSRYSGLTDGLNNCSLKKRIIMMEKTKFKKGWVTRGIAVCGFAMLGGLIIHIPAVATVLETNGEFETTINNYPDAYVDVDKIAEYEGGEIQLLRDLSMYIQYPQEAEQNGIQGRVVVTFQINKNGTISKCEVANSQNPILNEAALNAVEKLPGKWKPAEVNGKPVTSVVNIPVTFRLQPSGKESK